MTLPPTATRARRARPLEQVELLHEAARAGAGDVIDAVEVAAAA
jgi:hypothetical protein